MRKRAPAGEEGFTLIELLVSLAITAAASALLVAALWSGHAVIGRTGLSLARGESVATAQAVLRDRIGHLVSDATPIVGVVGSALPASAAVDAVGNAGAFSFVAAAPAARSPAAPMRYFIGRDRSGELLLATIDARAIAPRSDRARSVALLDHIAALEMAYYGTRTGDQAARWWAAWSGGDPPALVRIRLRFAQGDDRRWPDLIVHPQVSVAATCQVSPVNGDCA